MCKQYEYISQCRTRSCGNILGAKRRNRYCREALDARRLGRCATGVRGAGTFRVRERVACAGCRCSRLRMNSLLSVRSMKKKEESDDGVGAGVGVGVGVDVNVDMGLFVPKTRTQNQTQTQAQAPTNRKKRKANSVFEHAFERPLEAEEAKDKDKGKGRRRAKRRISTKIGGGGGGGSVADDDNNDVKMDDATETTTTTAEILSIRDPEAGGSSEWPGRRLGVRQASVYSDGTTYMDSDSCAGDSYISEPDADAFPYGLQGSRRIVSEAGRRTS